MKKFAVAFSVVAIMFSAYGAVSVKSTPDEEKETVSTSRVAGKANLDTPKKLNTAPKISDTRKDAQIAAQSKKKVQATRTNIVYSVIDAPGIATRTNAPAPGSAKVTATANDKRTVNKTATATRTNRARTATRVKLRDFKKIAEEMKDEK
jgi:hypothetical protein